MIIGKEKITTFSDFIISQGLTSPKNSESAKETALLKLIVVCAEGWYQKSKSIYSILGPLACLFVYFYPITTLTDDCVDKKCNCN